MKDISNFVILNNFKSFVFLLTGWSQVRKNLEVGQNSGNFVAHEKVKDLEKKVAKVIEFP